MYPTISENLDLSIGDRSVRLSPGEAFRLAERLIRRGTVRMIEEELDEADPPPIAAMPAPAKRAARRG